MEFNYLETQMFQHKDNELNEINSYLILSKNSEVQNSDFENVISIIDETGTEVSCTYDKFVEIFDKDGLSGFIM